MKKGIALILVTVVINSCVQPIYADSFISSIKTTNKQEILFRGIPWRSNVKDAEADFKGFFDMHFGEDYTCHYTADILGYDYCFTENPGTGYMTALYGEMEVAGHTVDTTWLYYATIFDNDEVDFDKCSYELYGAKYEFSFKDLEGTAYDLLNKLTDLYGSDYETISDRNESIYLWSGENDTACSLVVGSTWKTIEVAYTWKGGDELLKHADDLITAKVKLDESEIYGNGNTDGL